MLARLEVAVEQSRGQWIEQLLLNGALERSRAELRIVALPGQMTLGLVADLERELLRLEPLGY